MCSLHIYSVFLPFYTGFRCIQTPEPKRRLSSSSMVSRSTISIDSLELQPSEEKFRTMYSKRLTVGEVPTQVCDVLTAIFIPAWNKIGFRKRKHSQIDDNVKSF